jgi:hypothetical protein
MEERAILPLKGRQRRTIKSMGAEKIRQDAVRWWDQMEGRFGQ